MDTHEHFRKVHGKLMQEELADRWAWLRPRVDRRTLEVTFPGGSWIAPFAAEDHHSKSARGIRADAVLADEADDVPIGVYQAVVLPWFSEPWSYRLRVAGGTPRKGRHGLLYELHRLGLSDDEAHKLYHTRHATYLDAPETVAPEMVEAARNETPPRIFRREWEADFDSAEGLVYDLFSEAFHVRRPPTDAHWTEVLVGVDWGYVDPGVFLVVGIMGHGEDSEAYVLEEHYESGEVLSWWTECAAEIRERYPRAKWHADPSQPASIETLRTQAGVSIRKADNRLPQGIACVADKLMVRSQGDEPWARLYVSPDCPNTITEFAEYRRKPHPRDPDTYTEQIQDRNNHAMDALRYALFAHYGEPPHVRTEWTGGAYG
jgi:hypothetical protein